MTMIARVKTIGSTVFGSGTEYEVGDELTVEDIDNNNETGLPRGFYATGKDGKPMYATLIESSHLDDGDWELIECDIVCNPGPHDDYDRAMGVL